MQLLLPLAKGQTSENLQTILITLSIQVGQKHTVYIMLCLSQVYLRGEVEFFHLDCAGQKNANSEKDLNKKRRKTRALRLRWELNGKQLSIPSQWKEQNFSVVQ